MKKNEFDKQAKNNKSRGNPNWKKGGPSPNPTGRPKTRTISEWYRHWLTQPSTADPTRVRADVIAERQTANAELGDLAATREITDRTEGKPQQRIDVAIDDRKRDLVERGIEAIMLDKGVSREEAIEQLSLLVPDVSKYVH